MSPQARRRPGKGRSSTLDLLDLNWAMRSRGGEGSRLLPVPRGGENKTLDRRKSTCNCRLTYQSTFSGPRGVMGTYLLREARRRACARLRDTPPRCCRRPQPLEPQLLLDAARATRSRARPSGRACVLALGAPRGG